MSQQDQKAIEIKTKFTFFENGDVDEVTNFF